MRDILFRGKFAGWQYGYLSVEDSHSYLRMRDGTICEVDAATVGQYTGKEDKHGEKIFEGDILTFCAVQNGKTVTSIYKAYWHDELLWFMLESNLHDEPIDLSDAHRLHLIGNIHDTPELWHPYEPSEGGDA